jgi:hypothetical protein
MREKGLVVREEEVCSPCGGKGRSMGCIGSPCHITQATIKHRGKMDAGLMAHEKLGVNTRSRAYNLKV